MEILGVSKNQLEMIKKIVDYGLKEKPKAIQITSESEMARMYSDQYDNPEIYYSFRFLNYSLRIVRTKYSYQESEKKFVQTKYFVYALEYCGWRPAKELTNDLKYCTYSGLYGSFEGLKDAISEFQNGVVDFLKRYLNLSIATDLDLFANT